MKRPLDPRRLRAPARPWSRPCSRRWPRPCSPPWSPPTRPPRAAAWVLATLLLGSGSASAGPAIACADGPDPWRFRPERPIAALADEPEPHALAAAPGGPGAGIIALAWLTPDREVACTTSLDGGCTFGPAVVLSEPGVIVTTRPEILVRAEPPARVEVAWQEGASIVVRRAPGLAAAFEPAIVVGTDAVGPPRGCLSSGGAPAALLTWVADDGGARVPRVVTDLDGSGWGAPQDLVTGDDAAGLAASCDLAGPAGEPGFTLLASLVSAQAHSTRWAVASGWSAWRRVDDGSSTEPMRAALAASRPAGAAWTAWAWTAADPAGDVRVGADAALVSDGLLAAEFEGAAGGAAPVLDAGGAAPARPAVAVAGPAPGAAALAFFEEAGEIHVARRLLDEAAPRLSGGCGPERLTGLSPLRSMGGAHAPVAASLGDDVAIAFADDRSGTLELHFKRSDDSPPAVTLIDANPAPCGQPPSVALAWSAPPCDAVLVTVHVGRVAGGTDFTRDLAPGGAIVIDGLEPDTGYFFRVVMTDSAGHAATSNEVSALTPACSEALVRSELAALLDACAVGGAGGDGSVDPGETLRVSVLARNDGTEVATALRLRLIAGSGLITVRTGARDLGDLAPGASAMADFDVDLSATAACGGPFEVLAVAEIAGAAWGDRLALPAAMACTPCRDAACSVIADAGSTAPQVICRGQGLTLDATASSATSCAGVLLHEWWAGASLVGTGSARSVQPVASVSYRLITRCSTDLACFSTDDVFVTVNQLPSVSIDHITPPPACEGSSVTLRASASDPAAAFLWNDGTTGASLTTASPGVFQVTATDSNGCRASRSARVDFARLPAADAGPDVSACGARRIGTPGDPLLDHAWSPVDGLSDPFAAQPVASPGPAREYVLTVTDPLSGCSSSDQVQVALTEGPGPVRSLRVSRVAQELVLSWEPVAGAAGVRAYADTEAARAASAGSFSPTARLTCAGEAGCRVVLPSEPLIFFQAVAACPDGLGEGPN